LPEKMARTLTGDELPRLDRPVRFTVLRGSRGAVRASTLDELQDILDRPWSPGEVASVERSTDLTPRDERRIREVAREFRRPTRKGHGRRRRRGP
jgi:ATP-dependent helicase HrpA